MQRHTMTAHGRSCLTSSSGLGTGSRIGTCTVLSDKHTLPSALACGADLGLPASGADSGGRRRSDASFGPLKGTWPAVSGPGLNYPEYFPVASKLRSAPRTGLGE